MSYEKKWVKKEGTGKISQPELFPRVATGTSSGDPTAVPPGDAWKSSVTRRGKTRGRGTQCPNPGFDPFQSGYPGKF